MSKLFFTQKDNPKLEQRVMADGKISLYLEYYFGRQSEPVLDEHGEQVFYESGKMAGKPKFRIKHLRKKEILNLFLISKPRTPIERAQNKETLALASKIRYERAQELLEDKEGYRLTKARKINLLEFFQEFVETTKVKNRWLLVGALKDFQRFLAEEYPHLSKKIEAKHLNKEMVQRFVDFLNDNHRGQGVDTYYGRFRRMVNYAVEKGVIKKSPCKGVTTPKMDDVLTKDILSQEEMQKLFATHYEGENPEIRRAFAMTCLSGIRRCDIVRLKYKDVDYSNRLLTFRQAKTEGRSRNSGVTIPLNDKLLSLIGKKEKGAKDDLIFHLPSDTMTLKALRHWTKRAGIDKHITWHCGRHSFATALLSNGCNIKVVSSLLGHSSLQFTEIYLRAMDKQKEDAINSLPTLNF